MKANKCKASCGDVVEILEFCAQCANAILHHAKDFDPALIDDVIEARKRINKENKG